MNSLTTEADLVSLVSADEWMMRVLRAAETLHLPEWMIGAGFVRSKVWDYLSNKEHVHTNDIDLIYFNPDDLSAVTDAQFAIQLREMFDVEWEVVNQARVHLFKNTAPAVSAEDGMAHWTETATAVAVTLEGGRVKVIAPYGIDDLVHMVVRSCPKYPEGEIKMRERVEKKKWLEKWPQLRIIRNDDALKVQQEI